MHANFGRADLVPLTPIVFRSWDREPKAIDERRLHRNNVIMAKSILIADDDPHIRELLAFALEKAGMQSRAVEDGEAALAAVAHQRPDLVILDINMPKMDGLEVCRRLRSESDIPILFLSSRDDEIDRVLGIELGADDYVVKPFSPREVVARVTAILRRSAGKVAAEPTDAERSLQYNGLNLDLEGWRASWRGAAVALTVTEFGMLKALASAPGRVLSRDNLIDQLHGPGFAVTDRTIDSHIRNLRGKFAKAGCDDLIETRAGLGYSIGKCGGSG
jgi:two-component system, OmpR family, response regulator